MENGNPMLADAIDRFRSINFRVVHVRVAKVTVRSSPPPIYPLTITVQLNYLTYLVPCTDCCSRGAPESEIYAALLIIPTYTVIHS
jgi:hypothetical protein